MMATAVALKPLLLERAISQAAIGRTRISIAAI